MKKYFTKYISADDLIHYDTFIIAASTAYRTLIQLWKLQSLPQGAVKHINAKFLATDHCLKQTTKYYFKKCLPENNTGISKMCWLRLNLAHSLQSNSTQQRNCFKYSPLKHPERMFENAMGKQGTRIPHFPPLPNLDITLIGSFAFGKSYVIPLSSELTEIFFLFWICFCLHLSIHSP